MFCLSLGVFYDFMKEETSLDFNLDKISKKKIKWKNNFLRVLYQSLMATICWDIWSWFEEKKDLISINVVYEPTLNDQKPIKWFFLQIWKKQITLVLKTKDVEKNQYRIEMQNNAATVKVFLLKTKKIWKKKLAVCAGKIGINYVFNNGKILSYQDNYSKLGDLPFAVYYDFQATTGSVTFSMQRRM